MEIKPADLILVKGRDCLSYVIEDVEKSPYSHAAGVVKENELIEAQGFKRIGYQGIDYYDGQYDVFTCDLLTDEQRKEIAEYAKKQVGKRYDYLLLIWEFIRYEFGLMLPYRNTQSVICSELWSDAYQSVGIDLCPGIRYPSPADLAESKLLRKVTT